jgi:hypothetical protein
MTLPSSLVLHSRTILFLTLVAVALLMLASVAHAATAVLEKHEPFTDSFVNPCTREPIVVAGFMHLKITINVSRSGVTLSGIEVNFQNTQGVTLTGATYIVPAQSAAHVVEASDGMPMNVTAEETHQFIRQNADGTLWLDDDFFSHSLIHMTINANGVVTVNRMEFREECR